MQLKAIIIEDEEASRITLSNYLKKYCPDVELLAMADAVNSGLEAIRTHQPDIVFLDIEMPFGNAFDLLEQLDEINFETVFVTAFSNYAIKAIQFSAAYYILKPVDIDELVNAVEKIKNERNKKDHTFHSKIIVENIKMVNKQLQKIVLPVLDGFEVVQVKEIIRCQANDNYTEFFLQDNRKLTICKTLKFYEDLLKDFDFVRVHKSHLVNIQFIKKYKKGKGGLVILSDDTAIDVSPQKKKDLLSRF